MIYLIDNQQNYCDHIIRYIQSDLHSVPDVIRTINAVLRERYVQPSTVKLMAILREVEMYGLPVEQLTDWIDPGEFFQITGDWGDKKLASKLWEQIPPGMIKYLHSVWLRQIKNKDKNWQIFFNCFLELYQSWVKNNEHITILG